MTEHDVSYAGRTLAVILCMHRSGSSLVANLLQQLGMSLGPFELFGACESNPYGHFEAIPFWAINCELQVNLLGFADDVPRSPEVLQRFCQSEGQWPSDTVITPDILDRGTELVRQLVESGPISGFKDPRTVLAWPYWRRVFSRFPGLRVVPVFLARSPHEIAMSIFMRGKGLLAYADALDAAAVHYRRLVDILDDWRQERVIVRFDPRTFGDDLRAAAAACHLRWSDDLFAQVYDDRCRHHEPAMVDHPAEGLFRRLGGLPMTPQSVANLERLQRDAARREGLLQTRTLELDAEVPRLTKLVEQYHEQSVQQYETELELRERIAQLEHRIAEITGTRTWRLHERMVQLQSVQWLASALPAAGGRKNEPRISHHV